MVWGYRQMTVPDDSALLHARAAYDPAKARDYYLRTRQLKGRRPARVVAPKGPNSPTAVPVASKRRHPPKKDFKAERAALERRLNRLRDILAQKVKEAKARSGVQAPVKHTPKGNAAKNSPSNKNSKPLTAHQQHVKNAKARADYKPQSESQEIKQLRKQIADIRAKIDAAIKDAQANHKSTHQTASKGR